MALFLDAIAESIALCLCRGRSRVVVWPGLVSFAVEPSSRSKKVFYKVGPHSCKGLMEHHVT